MAAHVEEPIVLDGIHASPGPVHLEHQVDPAIHEHVFRSVQDGRKALKRATLALTFSIISAAGAWTNLSVTLFRALHHH